MATLRSVVHGVLNRAEIERLKWPVAWNGTVPVDSQREQEADRHSLADEALAALDEAELHVEVDGELAVRFEHGEIAEIVEAGTTTA